MPEEYRAYILCKLFHWTFDEYLDTPWRWCEDIIGFMNLEDENREPADGPRRIHAEGGG